MVETWQWDGERVVHQPSGLMEYGDDPRDTLKSFLDGQYRQWRHTLGFLKAGDWYIHEPTGRAARNLSALLAKEGIMLWFEKHNIFEVWLDEGYNCRYSPSGACSFGFYGRRAAIANTLTNERFVEWLEWKLNSGGTY